LAADDVRGLLAGRDRYAAYPADYLLEWAQSMLEKLIGLGLIIRKDDCYFPGKPATP
jgi:hypothetical protein